ncbi:MAG: hypothetical protein JOZ02_18110 [Acidobacteria bacterium]|nr:hypothetical protein [Acidobacteriota bacterium]
MSSILPSKQNVCPSCGAFNPEDAAACEACGAKLYVRRRAGYFDSNTHLAVALFIILCGALGFLGHYPPGSERVGKTGGHYATTAGDVLVWGVLPLTLGVIYLLFAIGLKVREKYFH